MYIYYNKLTGEYVDSDTQINKKTKLPFITLDDSEFSAIIQKASNSDFPCMICVHEKKLIIKPDPAIFDSDFITEKNYVQVFKLKGEFSDLNSLHRKKQKLKDLGLDTTSIESTIKKDSKAIEAKCKKMKIKIEDLI